MSKNLNMFPAVCHKFCASMGPDTLIPAKSMDRALNIKPLSVVVKNEHCKYIFWTKSKYVPYDFQLQDLLEDNKKPLEATASTRKFCEFNPQSNYSLSGKFGVQIMNELMDAELSASDTVTISSKLGTVNQTEIDLQSLVTSLQDRKLNFDHQFIQQLRRSKKKVLCVVQAVCAVEKDAEIKRTKDVNGEITAHANIGHVASTGSIDTKADYEKHQDIVVPGGTPIAYSVCEVLVNIDDGNMVPVMVSGNNGGFVPSNKMWTESSMDASDGGEGADPVTTYKQQMKEMMRILVPFITMSASTLGEIRNDLMKIVESRTALEYMTNLFQIFNDGAEKTLSLSVLKKNVQTEFDTCVHLLQIVGFEQDSDHMNFSKEGDPILEAMTYLFDALEELEDDMLSLIRCTKDEAKLLIHMCSELLVGQSLISLETFKSIIPPDGSVFHQIAESLGFKLDLANFTVISPDKMTNTVDAVFWVIYMLYHDKPQ